LARYLPTSPSFYEEGVGGVIRTPPDLPFSKGEELILSQGVEDLVLVIENLPFPQYWQDRYQLLPASMITTRFPLFYEEGVGGVIRTPPIFPLPRICQSLFYPQDKG